MSGSSSSSRKGKKGANSSSEKPKQPQRGLGVAQLEKIRIHSQMEETLKMQTYAAMQSTIGVIPPPPPSPHFGYPPSIMMGLGDMERANFRFGESQTYNHPSWNPSHGFINGQPYGPPGLPTRHLLNNMEDPGQRGRSSWLGMVGSSNQNPGSDDGQELDLELKL